jgi:hypothetical protein
MCEWFALPEYPKELVPNPDDIAPLEELYRISKDPSFL